MTPSISTTIKKMQEEAYPLHDLAKVLNNRAVHVITTTGNYEEGINLLATALKLTERSILLDQVPCSCKFCTLESCLLLSEERKRQHPSSSVCSSPSTRMDVVVDVDDGDFSKQESHATKNKKDSIDPSSIEDPMDYHDNLHDNTTPSPPTTNCPQQHESINYCKTSSSHLNYQEENEAEEDNDSGFVYRRFLLIDDHSINEHHYMGSTLSLVIIFNLALSHHLMGIDNNNNNKESFSSSSSTQINVTKNTKSLQHAVELYEIAYQLHINYTEQQSVHTDNNNNTMNMNIDNDDDDDHDNNNNNNNRADAHAVVNLPFIMIVTNNIGQIHRVAGNTKKYTRCLQHLLSSIMYVVGQQQLAVVPNTTVFNSLELEGLIRNVSPLVFRGSICASAA